MMLMELSNTLNCNICQATNCNPKVIHALKLLKAHSLSQLSIGLQYWEEHNRLVFFKGHIYILKVLDLQRKILQLCHNTQLTGHPERYGTLELVSWLYW